METISICNCDDLMNDPITIQCDHTTCLKSVEEFPICEIEIPDDGFKEMRKKEFSKSLHKLSKICVKCYVCKDNEAIKFCADCNFNYCSSCLKPHEIITSTSEHILMPIIHQNINDEFLICEVHMNIMDLYCEDCKVISCGECVALNHDNHKMTNASEHFDNILKKLQKNLNIKKKSLKHVINNYENSEKLFSDNELNASDMKKQILERGEDIKKVVDSLVTKLQGDIDEELQKHKRKAENVLVKLKELEKDLKSQIEFMEQEINELDYSNFTDAVPQNKLRNKSIVRYSEPFNALHFCMKNINFIQLHTLLVASKDVSPGMDVNCIDLKDHISLSNDGKVVTSTFSIASFQDEFYISRGSNVIHVFGYKELALKKTCSFKEITGITDMVVVNSKLFAAGNYKNDYKQNYAVVIRFDAKFIGKPHEIFKLASPEDDFKLSKSCFHHILLVTKTEILHLTENGDLIKKIALQFDISDALHLDDSYYICHCEMGMCVIGDDGDMMMCNPSTREVKSSTYFLEMDNSGFVYSGDEFGEISVFDQNLNFLYNYDKLSSIKCMCYNDAKHALLVICSDGLLVNIKI